MNYNTRHRIKKDTGENISPVSHGYKICPSCSFFCGLSEDDNFCSVCGAELFTSCKNCGKEIVNPYANYCKFCGGPLTTKNSKLEEF